MLASFGRTTRTVPVRRLERAEADQLGFRGPLVLAALQQRWAVGPWRPTGGYVVVRHPDTVVMEVSAAELRALGVDPDS